MSDAKPASGEILTRETFEFEVHLMRTRDGVSLYNEKMLLHHDAALRAEVGRAIRERDVAEAEIKRVDQLRAESEARADAAERELAQAQEISRRGWSHADAFERENQRHVAMHHRLAASRDRLAEALREAPHAMGCGATLYYGANEARYGKCNCWKAAALKREEEK